MKKIFLILLFTFLFAFNTNASTGFIPGQIWYSSEDFKDGESINIYTVVWNGESSTVDMKVDFYDNNILLGARDVSVPSNSTKQVSISWRVSSGNHTIFAKITSPNTLDSKKSISLKNSETDKDNFFVPVTIIASDGSEVTSGDIIENQIDKAGAKIIDSVPSSVSEPVLNVFSSVENFRNDSSLKINEIKEASKKTIDSFSENKNKRDKEISLEEENNKDEKANLDKDEVENKKINISGDNIKKPLEYVKFFLFSFLFFIFSKKVIFYLIIAFLIFVLFRFIYRKIRKR